MNFFAQEASQVSLNFQQEQPTQDQDEEEIEFINPLYQHGKTTPSANSVALAYRASIKNSPIAALVKEAIALDAEKEMPSPASNAYNPAFSPSKSRSLSRLQSKIKTEQDWEKEYLTKKDKFEKEIADKADLQAKLENDCKMLQEKIETLKEKLESETKKWDQTAKYRVKLPKSNQPITLNVGGKKMKATLQTLTDTSLEKNSVLAKMFDGEYPLRKCEDGSYFIDCDPALFKYILHWLRYGNISIDCEYLKERLSHVAEYFGLNKMKASLKDEIVNEIDEETAELTTDSTVLSQNDFTFLLSTSKYQKKPLILTKKDLKQLDLSNITIMDAEIVDCDLSGIQISKAKFHNCNFKYCDFSGCTLSNCEMIGCDLSNSKFVGASLNGVTLKISKLFGCNIEKAICRNVNFNLCDLTQVASTSTGYDLSSSQFSGSMVNERLLRKSTSLRSTNWSRSSLIGFDLSSLDFFGSDFSLANLSNCNLSKTNLSNCNFEGANFTYCNLDSALLRNSSLNKAILFGCNIKSILNDGLSLSGAKLCSAFFDTDVLQSSLSVTGVDFTDCNLEGFQFTKLDLSRAVFKHANLQGAVFTNCNLTEADFSQCNLSQTLITNSNMFGANLSKCNLNGHDFAGSNINICGSNFDQAIVDITFDSEAKSLTAQLTNPKRAKKIGMSQSEWNCTVVLTKTFRYKIKVLSTISSSIMFGFAPKSKLKYNFSNHETCGWYYYLNDGFFCGQEGIKMPESGVREVVVNERSGTTVEMNLDKNGTIWVSVNNKKPFILLKKLSVSNDPQLLNDIYPVIQLKDKSDEIEIVEL